MSQFSPPPPPPPKKPRGCLFYGCLTALVLLVVFGVGGFFAVRYGIDKIVGFIEPYTEATPKSMPPSTMAGQDYQQLERRVADFPAAAREATEPILLVLSSDDLNALIANHPSWRVLEGKVHVLLDGDQVKADVSIPLDDIVENLPGFSRLQGRYLNGVATLNVVLVEGILVVKLQGLEVKGESPAAEFMAEIQNRNLVQDVAHGPDVRKAIDALESLTVADGRLTLRSKAKK